MLATLLRSCHNVNMLKQMRDKALRAALPLLATSMVGRALIDKGIALLAARTELPIKGEYMPEKETWLITVGEPGAPMQAVVHVNNDTLTDIIEELVPDLVDDRKISEEKIMSLLRRHLRRSAQ